MRFLSFFLVLSLFAQPPQPTGIPIKHVILYKHGMGFFEREGTAGAGEETRLDFKTTEMNDILKSLTVHDASGHRINSIRYDSNETLQQRLAKFPFSLGDDQLFSSFLDGLKGARLELKTADRAIAGSVVSARAIQVIKRSSLQRGSRTTHASARLRGDHNY